MDSDSVEILLVEPNPGDTRLFTERFKEAKFANAIHAVSDGESALDFIHRRDEYSEVPRPDLVLLDPQLPRTNGEDILAELRGDPELADVPVVILTSTKTEAAIVESRELDADEYFQKPVDPEEFVSLVQSIEEFWLALVQQSERD
jgi:DNA-binding response OmpR family regulator